MYAACCLRFLILLFWPLLTIPADFGTDGTEIFDFFLQDNGFGPLIFFRFSFFAGAVDELVFANDSNTDFSYLVGCTFSAPICMKVVVNLYI